MRASLPASVEIRQRLDPTCAIEGDAAQIHQVLMNLCTNAGHAMRGGGVLEVSLERIDIDEANAVRHGNVDPGRYVRRDGHPIVRQEAVVSAGGAYEVAFTGERVDLGIFVLPAKATVRVIATAGPDGADAGGEGAAADAPIGDNDDTKIVPLP